MRRTKLLGRGFQTIALALVLLVFGSGLALADEVLNNVVAGGNDTIVAGSSTTINYRVKNINNNGGDPQNPCNPADGTPVTIALTVPADVTASRTSFTLNSCEPASAGVTFSSNKAGSYAINVASILDAGIGTYTNNANFTLVVTAPPNTAPQVSVTGVENGATYRTSDVQSPGCSVVDAEDTNESATPEVTNPPYNGLGSHTVTCSYTDGGGLSDSDQVTYSVIRDLDTSAPVIGYSLNPASADGQNGWYKSSVALTWSVTESESPETLVKDGCVDQNITADQASTTYSCSAESEGGTAGPVQVSIKRDATAPTDVAGSPDSSPTNGWFNSPVSFTFRGEDATSGIASCSTATYSGPDGTGVTVSGSCTDNAGNQSAAVTSDAINYDATAPVDVAGSPDSSPTNGWFNSPVSFTFRGEDATSGIASCSTPTYSGPDAASATVSGSCTDLAGNESAPVNSSSIKYDATDPTDVAFEGGPAADSEHHFGSVPPAPTCSANDATSGLAGCVVTGYSTAVGTHTMTATATDNAGNTATATRTYTVLAWTLNGFFQPVDMGSAVWNTVKGGSTVPLKFEVFSGLTELTSTSVIKGFTASPIVCPNGNFTIDAIEFLTTGGTSLRYDSLAGQFIQNWQTPKKPGACYRVTMTTLDGSQLSANFMLK